MQAIHDEQDLGNVYDTALLCKLLGYARPHALALVGCVALLLVLAGLQLAQPFLIKLALDQVLTPSLGADAATRVSLADRLWPLAGMYLATVIVAAVIEYTQGLWLKATGQSIISRIRVELFAHLQSLGLAFFDRNPVGRLVTRMTNDVEALNEMYTSVLVNLFRDVFFIAGAAAVMLWLDWRLAAVSFAAVPAIAAAAAVFQGYSRKAWREVRVRIARINATLSENLSGMRLIQVFARETRQAAEFLTINHAHYEASMYQLRVYSIFRPLLELLSSVSLVAVIWYGGLQVIAGAVTLGTLFAFTQYNRQLFEPVNALAEKYNVLQSALAAAERIFQLMATAPDIQDQPGALTPLANQNVPPAVEFRDVSFAYQGEEWVLKDVSFQVWPGQTVAFVGHTGAGKSTIMSLVTRFYDVQRGSVLVDGLDVREWPQGALRRRVGTVMQDVFLFSGDIAGNIGLGDPRLEPGDLKRAAEVVGADAFIQALPGGYAAAVTERGQTLSSGQRQLISFARALAYDPAILVLDEATASIDSESEEQLQHGMRALSRGRTTLVVAHRLSTIQDADVILVMHKGRLHEKGSHEELLAQGGLYNRLWQLQFQDFFASSAPTHIVPNAMANPVKD